MTAHAQPMQCERNELINTPRLPVYSNAASAGASHLAAAANTQGARQSQLGFVDATHKSITRVHSRLSERKDIALVRQLRDHQTTSIRVQPQAGQPRASKKLENGDCKHELCGFQTVAIEVGWFTRN